MQTEKFVHSYFNAWNHHDPQAIADHLSPNGIYIDVPEHTRRSPGQLITRLEEFFSRHWHHYELLGDILETDDSIAFQYRIIASERQGADSPVAYSGAGFITLNGDAAVAITDYYDFPVIPKPGKYAKSGLAANQLQRYKQDLARIMRTQKVYLRSDLALPGLAGIVGCSVNHLSQVINDGFGMSFFEYLNRYRVEHARKLLISPEYRDTSILDIGFDAGFNCNSSFYSAFRTRIGISPARYRKKQLENNRHRP